MPRPLSDLPSEQSPKPTNVDSASGISLTAARGMEIIEEPGVLWDTVGFRVSSGLQAHRGDLENDQHQASGQLAKENVPDSSSPSLRLGLVNTGFEVSLDAHDLYSRSLSFLLRSPRN